ncbi:TRAP transporter substrate-binding protein DctP [Marinovum sp. SP66]|uniref:TRAP transporter substrate-binding protein DctP n=1 Tax=Marinovum sp. SP66 TaxID=3028379 RepID=UPI00237B9D83|nr:TRAP transporter substrate-binding protein DctP [Marinovum sp. SP66]MDD9739803.1 TRAP transporter substrate-binding protein DctP [Marinovum sp. SP66]
MKIKLKSIALTIAMTLGPLTAMAAEIKWSMQTYASTGMSEYNTLVTNFAEKVEKASNGRMEIQVFPAGQVVSSAEVPEAVRAGALDLGNTFLMYYASKEPALQAINEWPAGFEDQQGLDWFYSGGGKELLRPVAERHNLYYLGVTTLLGENIWSNKKIGGIDDLKGLKLRTSGLTAESLAILGASPVSMSSEDIYTAMQRGTIDGFEFVSTPVHYGFGWHEVTKYVTDPKFIMGGSSDWIVNLDSWNALPDDLKAVIDNALRAASQEFFVQSRLEEGEIDKKLKEAGIEFITWPDGDLEQFEKARYQIVREKYWPASEEFREIQQSRMDFLRKLGYVVEAP